MSKKDILNFSFNVGKVGCLGLYHVGLVSGIKKKKWFLFNLILILHFIEAVLIGIKTGFENGMNKLSSAVCTLLFGFTWWLPIKMGLHKK